MSYRQTACILKVKRKRIMKQIYIKPVTDWENLRKGSLLEHKKLFHIFGYMSPIKLR